MTASSQSMHRPLGSTRHEPRRSPRQQRSQNQSLSFPFLDTLSLADVTDNGNTGLDQFDASGLVQVPNDGVTIGVDNTGREVEPHRVVLASAGVANKRGNLTLVGEGVASGEGASGFAVCVCVHVVSLSPTADTCKPLGEESQYVDKFILVDFCN